MFWLKTGVLSDKQIRILLGKKLFIWPFNINNLKGSTYNLTASVVARSASTNKLLVNEDREIIIKSGDTALIETEESIYVDQDICGTYHSKVKLVSKGLSHIGTTLDPYFFGTSLIAVHNHSKENQVIKVGDTFASIMFHKMPSSTKVLHDNQPFRSDIISLNFGGDDFAYIDTTEKQKIILGEISLWKEQPWRQNKESLIEQVGKYVKESTSKGKVKYARIFFSMILPVLMIATLSLGIYKDWFDKSIIPFISALCGASFPLISGIGKAVEDFIKGE